MRALVEECQPPSGGGDSWTHLNWTVIATVRPLFFEDFSGAPVRLSLLHDTSFLRDDGR